MLTEALVSPAGPLDRPQTHFPVAEEDEPLVAGHTLQGYPEPINHSHETQRILDNFNEDTHKESFYNRLWRPIFYLSTYS